MVYILIHCLIVKAWNNVFFFLFLFSIVSVQFDSYNEWVLHRQYHSVHIHSGCI